MIYIRQQSTTDNKGMGQAGITAKLPGKQEMGFSDWLRVRCSSQRDYPFDQTKDSILVWVWSRARDNLILVCRAVIGKCER